MGCEDGRIGLAVASYWCGGDGGTRNGETAGHAPPAVPVHLFARANIFAESYLRVEGNVSRSDINSILVSLSLSSPRLSIRSYHGVVRDNGKKKGKD